MSVEPSCLLFSFLPQVLSLQTGKKRKAVGVKLGRSAEKADCVQTQDIDFLVGGVGL